MTIALHHSDCVKWLRDWLLARYLSRRCVRKLAHLIRRKKDGSLWAASCPQDFGYAMRGLFSRVNQFHFCRVRVWRGLPIISRRVFWLPNSGEFDVLQQDLMAFWLAPWPREIECAKIDERHEGAAA